MPARSLLRIFVTGALAALPLVATVAIVGWLLALLWAWFGPASLVGGLMMKIGVGVTGSIVFGYLFGVALIAAGVFALGLLVEARLERGLAALVDGFMARIPLVQRDEDGLKSMRPVWCRFGGPDGGAAVLALQSTAEPVLLDGRRCLCVMVPTAPVPIGGALIYVPEEWVTPADIGVEGVTSLYVSMGVTSGQYLPKADQPISDA
jgi:uncharacterized membrane protein